MGIIINMGNICDAANANAELKNAEGFDLFDACSGHIINKKGADGLNTDKYKLVSKADADTDAIKVPLLAALKVTDNNKKKIHLLDAVIFLEGEELKFGETADQKDGDFGLYKVPPKDEENKTDAPSFVFENFKAADKSSDDYDTEASKDEVEFEWKKIEGDV